MKKSKLKLFAVVVIVLTLTTIQSVFALEVQSLYKKCKDSVVLIQTFDSNGNGLGIGSGFFVGDGKIIATNFHVIEGAEEVKVKLYSGMVLDITESVGVDVDHDLVLLSFTGNGKPLPLSDKEPAVGEEIISIGNPVGLENTVSNGIVSGIRSENGEKYYQITASISPGSSGGPILNSIGKVIGVATFYIMGGQNLNFAVPAENISKMLADKKTVSVKEVASKKSVLKWRLQNVPKEDDPDYLVWAIIVGDTEKIKKAIKKCADINTLFYGETPLTLAVRTGRINVVELLLKLGADVNKKQNDGHPPLYKAANEGYTEIVNLLIKNGADVNIATDKYRWTPLMIAAKNGFPDVVKKLITAGTDINVREKEGYNAFMLAMYYCNYDTATLLMKAGADLNKKKKNGWTPLHSAAWNGRLKAAEYLLKNGADVNTKNLEGCSPLLLAVHKGHMDVVSLLIKKGAQVNSESNKGLTVLQSAVSNENIKIVKLLVKNGAQDKKYFLHLAEQGDIVTVKILLDSGFNINVMNSKDQRTALIFAAENGHLKLSELLISKGASLEMKTREGQTALNRAVRYGHLEVVDLLLKSDADINTMTNEGWSLLQEAACFGHLEIVKFLFKKGANMSLANIYGYLPIHRAAEGGHLEIIKYLVEKGADVNSRTKNKWTALHRAVDEGHIEVVKYLMNNGADVNAKSSDGWAPLQNASKFGQFEIAKYLVNNGAVVDAKNKKMVTAAQTAAWHGHLNIVKLLVENGADIKKRNNYGKNVLEEAEAQGHTGLAHLSEKDKHSKVATQWLSSSELKALLAELGKKIDGKNFWNKGHWVDTVEGRWKNGNVQYRIRYSKVPPNNGYWWYWWYGQDEKSFRKHAQEMEDKEFTLVFHQSFAKPSGEVRYQGVWHKINDK